RAAEQGHRPGAPRVPAVARPREKPVPPVGAASPRAFEWSPKKASRLKPLRQNKTRPCLSDLFTFCAIFRALFALPWFRHDRSQAAVRLPQVLGRVLRARSL